MKCIQECYESFGVGWVNGGDIAQDTIIGDGSTRGYVGTPLSWNSESGPVSSEVPSTTPDFTGADFISINEDMMCSLSFKLHSSLSKSKITMKSDSS